MRIYLDNAATTAIDKDVLATMLPLLEENFGNPSSTHWHGRQVRSLIEKSRKTIAELLNTTPSEIFFTSGGTEADNTAICGAIHTFHLKHAISTKIEHHAVEHTLLERKKRGKIDISYLDLDEKGNISLTQLDAFLQKNPKSLVSLMHANNEIGNLMPIAEIGELCKHYGAYFHSDTVQTMGHFAHNLKELNIDYLVGAAHKFHGPKGIGFLYVNGKSKINPFITGGAQERNMRGGTENIYGIIGVAKALEIAYKEMQEHKTHILSLKKRMIDNLKESIEDVRFNGESGNLENSLYTVLNVSLPENKDNDMLLFNLDIAGISASGGSACSSGAEAGSHVLAGITHPRERVAVRFSFSKYNTIEEIDYTVKTLAEMFETTTANPSQK